MTDASSKSPATKNPIPTLSFQRNHHCEAVEMVNNITEKLKKGLMAAESSKKNIKDVYSNKNTESQLKLKDNLEKQTHHLIINPGNFWRKHATEEGSSGEPVILEEITWQEFLKKVQVDPITLFTHLNKCLAATKMAVDKHLHMHLRSSTI